MFSNLFTQIIIFLVHYTSKTYAACSGLSQGSTSNTGGVGYSYESSARPGIWYLISYFSHSQTGYYPFDQNRCPSGTSLAYIKNNDEWIDYKFLRGICISYTSANFHVSDYTETINTLR